MIHRQLGMIGIIAIFLLAGIAQAQCDITYNPVSGFFDCASTGTGPAGPTGPTGPVGATGPTGPVGPTGSGYSTIQDEGSGLTARTIVNVIGSGVNCVDNAGASKTDCTFTGGGASAVTDLTDCKVTVTSTVATLATCKFRYLAADNTYTVTTIAAATLTIAAGTESATPGVRFGLDENGGSPIVRCNIDTGLTTGNYTASGCTKTSANNYGSSVPMAEVTLASGAWTTVTEQRALPSSQLTKCGTGLVLSGDRCAANSAVIPFLAGGTIGMPVGSVASAPSAPNSGDIWYDTTLNKFRCRENGVSVDCISTGGGTPGGTADGQIQWRNGGGTTFGGDAGAAWDNTNKILTVTRANSTGLGGRIIAYNSNALNTNTNARVDSCNESTFDCLSVRRGYFNLDGTPGEWSQIFTLLGSSTHQLIGRKDATSTIHVGGDDGAGLGWLAFTASGATRFANVATAGLGLAPIMGAPTELTAQTGDVGNQTLLATSHTAGMYRVCGFVAITTAGTGTMAATTLTWRSPASGSDLNHDLLFEGEVAATTTPLVTAQDEFNVCKVIRSTGASAIVLNPGNTDATYTTAWTVERLR